LTESSPFSARVKKKGNRTGGKNFEGKMNLRREKSTSCHETGNSEAEEED